MTNNRKKKLVNLTKAIKELVRAVNAANLAIYEEMVAEGHATPTRRYFALSENRIALTVRMTKQFGTQVAEVR